MAIRKENSVATRRSKPKSSAPIMVEPERETPGINAKHCAKPTLSASRTVISPSAPIRGARRPAQCGNRADLNHDIKGFGLLTGKIQRAAQNNQMPAAGYRDKFCKALGNAEQ